MAECCIKENRIDDVGNDWRKVVQIQLAPAYRIGWLGVWDSLKAAVTNKPRTRVAVEVKFGVYVKAPGELYIWGAQIEENPPAGSVR